MLTFFLSFPAVLYLAHLCQTPPGGGGGVGGGVHGGAGHPVPRDGGGFKIKIEEKDITT